MNITIDISQFDLDVEQLIADKLRQHSIPECFGMMTLPLIEKRPSFKVEEIFEHKDSVEKADIINKNPLDFIGGSSELIKDFVFTKKSFLKLTELLDKKATEYVEQAVKCINCTYADKCYKLTKNYHSAINLLK